MPAPTKSEYDIQAETWAAKHGVTMSATFTGHHKYFPDDADTRDVYRITLTRSDRSMSFDFGQALNDSRVEDHSDGPYWKRRQRDIDTCKYDPSGNGFNVKAPNRKRIPPTLYNVITCIEKYDPYTFEDWCSSVGYDTDSRKALDTFLACQKQYADFLRLCGGEGPMLDEAREIQ